MKKDLRVPLVPELTRLVASGALQQLVPTALAEDHQLLSELLSKTLRDPRAEHPGSNSSDQLEDRLPFLRAIAPRGTGGCAGSWQNAAGALQVTPAGETKARLASSVSAIMSQHVV